MNSTHDDRKGVPRPSGESAVDDDLVVRAAQEYLALVEGGQRPDRSAFVARYPEIAQALAECLGGLDFLQAAVPELSGPAANSAAALDDEKSPLGGMLGEFRILREVGRGGMGIVYEAEQVSLGRRVALKVLPFAAALDAKQLQRFKNEALAAAHLQHQNIVPVHSVGCERGVYFYAMQFIEGQTLAAVIDDLRRLSGKNASELPPTVSAIADALASGRLAEPQPTRPGAPDTKGTAGLSTQRSITNKAYFRTVAHLGVQAAEALEHAHQFGVIHRDIKPANLLVDVRNNLWIADFGLAQFYTANPLTLTGDLVGTLRYMSPEQAQARRLPIDHRTDVYSLGVTLYELLTLEPAFPGDVQHDLLRQIVQDEPRRPRRLNKSMPPELETIVLKAMEKNAADRYAAARDLARDLHSFLEDRPIQARRPSWLHVGVKWARRHRTLVGAAAVVFLMALLFFGTSWLWWAAKRSAAEGEARVALQDAAGLQSKEKWHDALNTVRRAQGILIGVGADPNLRNQIDELSKDLDMACRIEESRVQNVLEKDGDSERRAALAAMAGVFAWYGLDVDNLDLHQAAERIRARTIRMQLVAALDEWALIRERVKDERWRHLVAIARAVDADPWRNRMRDALESRNPKAVADLAVSAQTEDLAPATAVFLGVLATGTPARDEALKVLRMVQQRHPEDFWINHTLGFLLIYKVDHLSPAEWEEAHRVYTAAVALQPRGPGVHLRLGYVLNRKGLPDQAIFEYREAIRLKPDYWLAHSNVFEVLMDKGQVDDAIVALKRALKDLEVPGVQPRESAAAHRLLGDALTRQGRWDDAIAEYRNAIALDATQPLPHCHLGLALQAKGEFAKSLDSLKTGHELGSRTKGWNVPSAEWVRRAEQFVEFDSDLPKYLSAQLAPADADQRVGLAQLCRLPCRRFYAASARFFREAFAADPKFGENVRSQYRYQAARAAALAGCGKGQDAADLGAEERIQWRVRALAWLRADLAAWRSSMEKEPERAESEERRALNWQSEPDFEGVRAAAALASLPDAERATWQRFWQEVAALRRRGAERR